MEWGLCHYTLFFYLNGFLSLSYQLVFGRLMKVFMLDLVLYM